MSAVELLSSLSHEVRLSMISLLGKHEDGMCVNDVAKSLDISQSTASHHLLILGRSGAVDFERRQSMKIYRAKPLAVEIVRTATEAANEG